MHFHGFNTLRMLGLFALVLLGYVLRAAAQISGQFFYTGLGFLKFVLFSHGSGVNKRFIKRLRTPFSGSLLPMISLLLSSKYISPKLCFLTLQARKPVSYQMFSQLAASTLRAALMTETENRILSTSLLTNVNCPPEFTYFWLFSSVFGNLLFIFHLEFIFVICKRISLTRTTPGPVFLYGPYFVVKRMETEVFLCSLELCFVCHLRVELQGGVE